MNPQDTYEKIREIAKQAACKIMNVSTLDSFLKLDLKSQLLGIKVLAYTGHEFGVVREIESLEKHLNNLPTMD
jgi:hypothetical protein